MAAPPGAVLDFVTVVWVGKPRHQVLVFGVIVLAVVVVHVSFTYGELGSLSVKVVEMVVGLP